MENMNTVVVLFMISILCTLTIFSVSKKRHHKTANPPGPLGLPIIGNLHQLKFPLHEYFFQLSRKYGPLVYLKLGSRRLLVAKTPETAQEILKTQDLVFCSRPAMLSLRKLSYECHDIALSPYDKNWRDLRKTCVLHLLSVKRVHSFRPIREDEVSRMVELLAQKSGKVRLSGEIRLMISTVTTRVAYGKRYELGSNERRRFVDNVREFQSCLTDFYVTDYFPLMGWLDVVMGKIAHLDKVVKKWDAFYQQLINEHLCLDRPKSMDGDVIDILLKLRQEQSFDLPLYYIKAVLVDVYVASTDSIANPIIWAMTSLIKNPSVMAKAQAEIRESMMSQANKQIVEEEIAAELPYLNAVIREVLRMYPPVPLLLPRETMKNCTINGFEIPAKTLVLVNAWALSNDPNTWDKPEEFIPERFLVDNKLTAQDLKTVHDFEMIPFGSGRRACPGSSMALATVQLVLANLLCLFDWELPDGLKSEDIDTDVLDGFTMHKKNPLYLLPKKYNNI